MRWSSALHYVGALDDHPSQTCAFPGIRGWAGVNTHNVLGAIRNVSTILENYAELPRSYVSDDAANEALKFFVHFLGDMHMPLHLTGRDRGGNSDKVRFNGRLTNLHSVWDTLLIAKAIRETPPKYSYPLPSPWIEYALRGTIYDSYVRRIMWEGILDEWTDDIDNWLTCPAVAEPATKWQQVLSTFRGWIGPANPGKETDDNVLCPYYWASSIHQLNCQVVWPKELDEPPYKNVTSRHLYSSYGDAGCKYGECGESSADGYQPGIPYLELDIPAYSGAIKDQMIIEKLLAQAGIRLAALLNRMFATPDSGTDPLWRQHFTQS